MKKDERDFIKTWFTRFLATGFFSSRVSLFIACQFALECNFGRSYLAKAYNNFCGMKIPYRRAFYGFRVDGLSFAAYYSPYNCLNDYVSWIFFNRPLTYNLKYLDSFKLFLRDSGYCPEKDYINRITDIYNQFIKDGQTK